MATTDPDVLVVGAGPAGMLLASALHRQGIRYRIVDQDDGPTDLTRAPVLWQRTQEILDALGIHDAWVDQSDEQLEESLHFYGSFAGRLPLTAPNSPFPKARYAGQYVTERILDAHLTDLGLPVEYDREAVSYREEGDTATVTLRHGDGREEDVTARWVVSAEGSGSTVRHAVGLDFEGEQYVGFRIHIADVHVQWTISTPIGETFFFIEKQGYMGGQRMPGHPDRFYFYILTVDDQPDKHDNDLPIEEAERLVRHFSGDDEATLSDPRWLDTARYKHGVASRYRSGRAFLVGDAARSAPPLYGQGMNYAMQDAWNLAWKLGHVVRGHAPEALLDTFDAERRKVGLDLDKRIDGTFRFITDPKPLQAPVVKTAAGALLQSGLADSAFDAAFTEVAIDYVGVGLGAQKSSLGRLRAGDRAPALWVKSFPDLVETNVLTLFDGIHWTLVVIGSPTDEPDRLGPLLDRARAVDAAYPLVRAALLSQGPRRPADPLPLTVIDAEGRYVRDNHLPSAGVLLVRPDGYIGWAGSDTDGLDDYLDRWATGRVPVPA